MSRRAGFSSTCRLSACARACPLLAHRVEMKNVCAEQICTPDSRAYGYANEHLHVCAPVCDGHARASCRAAQSKNPTDGQTRILPRTRGRVGKEERHSLVSVPVAPCVPACCASLPCPCVRVCVCVVCGAN
jgi:hypothetical protein